jgi:protein-tyrosine phosphatase
MRLLLVDLGRCWPWSHDDQPAALEVFLHARAHDHQSTFVLVCLELTFLHPRAHPFGATPEHLGNFPDGQKPGQLLRVAAPAHVSQASVVVHCLMGLAGSGSAWLFAAIGALSAGLGNRRSAINRSRTYSDMVG